ncbi:TauD/TfdA family dioxygenase [Streptomyces sp. NRRL WC-3744]|uniref:TauD/TfdA family dioxygenase n=1 Tax=Streptomyces sp. NRRL WC-3744 TaxID=1463935 RepID=UPI0004C57FA2|nr:TauD/TfdA family dioxygenase [Streptomyces sp. NRRL WC-3744]
MSTALVPTHPRTLEVPAEAFHTFSEQAQSELAAYVAELDRQHPQGRVDAVEVDLSAVPLFTAEVDGTRDVIDSRVHFIVYDRVAGVRSLRQQALYAWVLGTALGRPMVQNTDGWRLIEVYDRGVRKTIEDGARYHQTKQGSYMHNDAVNDVDPIDYLLLSCGQSAYIGGESILVDAKPVHDVLAEHPDVLKILTQDFWFEKRGMSLTAETGFFRSPIIRYTAEGEPLVRYFRTYIEVAHEKKGEPITDEQRAALDFFDAVLDQSSVQYRIRLERGQTLVSADDRFLHTRTAFYDRFAPREIDLGNDSPDQVNRYMFRMWSSK